MFLNSAQVLVGAMNVTYFKRYRMEIRLERRELPALQLPAGYEFVAWDPILEAAHAEAKFRSFCEEIDANVFPSLAAHDGCRRLMTEISHRAGFIAEATWLVVTDRVERGLHRLRPLHHTGPTLYGFGHE